MNEFGAMETGWLGLVVRMSPGGNGSMEWSYDKDWYYLSDNGTMLTGWQYLYGNWYYIDESGLVTTGWQYVDGNWYYMNEFGAMVTGWLGFVVEMYPAEIGYEYVKDWYYFKPNGCMACNETLLIDDKTFTFNASGRYD